MIENILIFSPLVFLIWLINLSEKRRSLEKLPEAKVLGWVSYSLVILGFVGVMILGFIMFIIGLAPAEVKQEIFKEIGFSVDFSSMGLGMVIPAIIAIITLIPPVRRGVSRFIPIDPQNRLHVISLSLSLLVIIQIWTTLAAGLGAINEMTSQISSQEAIISAWSQTFFLVVIGLLGVGLFTRRSPGEAFKRLGIVRPTVKQVLFGVGIAIPLLGLAIGAELLSDHLGMGIDENINELTDKLIGSLFTTIPGILTLGLAAAIGEETIFRGAMQPKFGLILTSILFALTHANYGFSLATLIVLIAGLSLGVIRNRTNTSTSMITHATYNIALGLISYFQIM